MALAIDATTPARVNASAAVSAVSGSFTPPAGALLIVTAQGTNGSTGPTSVAVTNSGTALTWTQVQLANKTTTGGGDGFASIHRAVVGTSAAMTVTATQTGGSAPTSIKVYVVTGANTTTPVGTAVIGRGTTTPLTTTALTTTGTNSLFFASADEWSAPAAETGTAGSGMTWDSWGISGSNYGGSGYKTVAAPASTTTALSSVGGSGTMDWQYVVVEVFAAAAAAAPPRPVRTITQQALTRAATR